MFREIKKTLKSKLDNLIASWPREPGQLGPKQMQKKEAILSKNDDFGKLSKFPEKQKKTVKYLKINCLYS